MNHVETLPRTTLALAGAVVGCAALEPEPPTACERDEDCASLGAGWFCDTSADTPICAEEEPANYYGPPPCTDEGCVAAHGAGWYCNEEAQACAEGPVMYYGPLPACSDAECQSTHGAGWYCDETSGLCVEEQDCEPLAYYGPPPCDTDEECVEREGAGWYCDQENTVQADSCGNTAVWPICVQQEDCEPMAFYGPQPCADDDECQADHGAGWYCDLENTFSDGCGNSTVWPVCAEETVVGWYGPLST